MERFGDYMFHLLHGPLKKAWTAGNQFRTLLRVLGKHFDEAKRDLNLVRADTMIITAEETALMELGKERDMPRLDGEPLEDYRLRLLSKRAIAEQAGTNQAILLTLARLGYDRSFAEPCFMYDPERWAEVDVYLGSNLEPGIRDVELIAREVDKVKPASAKINYMTEQVRKVAILSGITSVGLMYPMCGLQRCGEPVNLY